MYIKKVLFYLVILTQAIFAKLATSVQINSELSQHRAYANYRLFKVGVQHAGKN